jgi:hypothetical protein
MHTFIHLFFGLLHMPRFAQLRMTETSQRWGSFEEPPVIKAASRS